MSKDIEIVIKISVPHEFGGSIKVDSNTEKKDYLGLSKVDREVISKWKKNNPKFNENNVPKSLMDKLIWMQLKKVRKSSYFNQNNLAQAVDLKQVTISHVENGRAKPSLEAQERIANALNYDLEDLIETMKNLIDWSEHEDAIAKDIELQEKNVPAKNRRYSLRKLGV